MSLSAASPACAIILGMHRSGTSVLGNVLAELGYSVGRSPMLGTEENPKGYFENWAIMKAHDELLSSADSNWNDLHFMPDDWWNEARAQLWGQHLWPVFAGEYAGLAKRLIKDPRMCRLLPAWQAALKEEWEQAYFFLPVRHPEEVAASLCKRDGFTMEYGIALWLAHVLPAESGTRGRKRLVLLQDRLLKGEENARISVFLGMAAPEVDRAVEEAVDVALRHHRLETRDILPGNPFGALAARAWQAFLELAEGGSAETALDQIKAEFQLILPLVSASGPMLLKSPRSRLQVDCGQGFREQDRFFQPLPVQAKSFRITFAGLPGDVRAFRWAPLEGYACRVKISRAESNRGPVVFAAENALDQWQGFDRFFSFNPGYAASLEPASPTERAEAPVASQRLASAVRPTPLNRQADRRSQRNVRLEKSSAQRRPQSFSSRSRQGLKTRRETVSRRAHARREQTRQLSKGPPAFKRAASPAPVQTAKSNWLRLEGEIALLTPAEILEKFHQERAAMFVAQQAVQAAQAVHHRQQEELQAAHGTLKAYGLTPGVPARQEMASVSRLFVDLGDGFKAEHQLSVNFHTEQHLFAVDFVIPEAWQNSARAWRWMPAAGTQVMCGGIHAEGDSRQEFELTAENSAGTTGEWVVFLTEDPAVLVQRRAGLEAVGRLRFSGHMKRIDPSAVAAMYQEEIKLATAWIEALKKERSKIPVPGRLADDLAIPGNEMRAAQFFV